MRPCCAYARVAYHKYEFANVEREGERGRSSKHMCKRRWNRTSCMCLNQRMSRGCESSEAKDEIRHTFTVGNITHICHTSYTDLLRELWKNSARAKFSRHATEVH